MKIARPGIFASTAADQMKARDPAALPPLTFDAGGAAGVSAAAPALVGVSAARCLLETGVVAVERVLGDSALRTLRGHAERIFARFDRRLADRRLDFRTQNTAFSFASVASRDRGRLDVGWSVGQSLLRSFTLLLVRRPDR